MVQDLPILKDQCFQATVCSCGFSLVFLKLFRVSVCLLSVWCCLLTSFPLKTAYRMLIDRNTRQIAHETNCHTENYNGRGKKPLNEQGLHRANEQNNGCDVRYSASRGPSGLSHRLYHKWERTRQTLCLPRSLPRNMPARATILRDFLLFQ